MAYHFDFDDTILGDFEFPKETYRLILGGLNLLLVRVQFWNTETKRAGARAPYAREADVLRQMIDFGSRHHRTEPSSLISLHGTSVGSMRLMKAGMELTLWKTRNDLRENREAGWPSAALANLEHSIEELQRVADKLSVAPAEILWEVLPPQDSAHIAAQLGAEQGADRWDAFICHASEDKASFVRPLAEALQKEGLRIWYDEFSLRVGDSLRRSIDSGLSRSRYGVVVLSPSFFAKEWPQQELDGLNAREMQGQKVILPIWHGVDLAAVMSFSPMLAGRLATNSEKGLQQVVKELLDVLATPST